MDIQKSISKNYEKCKTAPENLKAELLFSIIQLKTINQTFDNIEQSVYCDIKSFIIAYLSSVESRDYGYDKINVGKIIKSINACKDSKGKHELLVFLNRILTKNGYINETQELRTELNKSKRQIIIDHNIGIKKNLKLLLHITSYNVYAIVITLAIIYFFSSLLFMPNDKFPFHLFSISYDHYTNNIFLNHFLNTLGGIFGIGDNYNLLPINAIGLIVLILFKLFYIIFIINYLYKKSLEIIQL